MSQNNKPNKSRNRKSEQKTTKNIPEIDIIEDIFTLENPDIKDILVILREIYNSQQFISTKYDELIKRNLELEKLCTNLSKENETLKKEFQNTNKVILNMENCSNERKLELHGIPKTQNEDLHDIILKISDNFDQKIKKEDIDNIYRVEHKTELRKNSPIVVSFLRKTDKDKFLTMRKRRSLYTNELNLGENRSQIFINEYLSKNTKELLWKTKKLKEEKKYKYVWTKGGTIFIKKNENSEVLKINTREDLEKIN